VEFSIAFPSQNRVKRIFDLVAGMTVVMVCLLTGLFRTHTSRKLNDALSVVRGKKSWVGYDLSDQSLGELPPLMPGILAVSSRQSMIMHPSEIHMINYIYAREYTVWKDVDLFLRNASRLM
jgi:hypothetical protein